MQSRRLASWRTALLLLTVAALALVPSLALTAPQMGTGVSDQGGSIVQSATKVGHGDARRTPFLYPRRVSFWAGGMPEYGLLTAAEIESEQALAFGVGSFRTDAAGLAFPEELLAAEIPTGPAYFVIQLRASALGSAEVIEQSMEDLAGTGATIVEYVPQNGYVVRVDPHSYVTLSASPLVQYIAPYHPGYKLALDIGLAPHPDPVRAESSVLQLMVSGFRGEKADDIAAAITSLGGSIIATEETADGPIVVAELDVSQIRALAKVEGVRYVNENMPATLDGEENAWSVIAGTYLPEERPLIYAAGVDGSGGYTKDIDVSPAGAGSPPAAGSTDTDWNGNGFLDNAAQIIAVTDTGAAIDGGDMADTAGSSGWLGGSNCNAGQGGALAGPNAGVFPAAMHRKLVWYKSGITAPWQAGDLCSCDPEFTHGTATVNQALGNASSGPFADDGVDWTGDGLADDYGTPFFFTVAPADYRVDGVAPGARLVFQDVGICPDPTTITTGTYTTLLTDARTKGARLHSLSFGFFNQTATLYDSRPQQIDGFLSTDAQRDYMLFVETGNSGQGTANTNFNSKAKTLNNEAASKNAVVVGGNYSGSAGVQNFLYFRSSTGPAPNGTACPNQNPLTGAFVASNCGRVKPDLVAPAADGDSGLAESYYCYSDDTNQTGNIKCTQGGEVEGTSFSSTLAAGAGALVRDYFAQGLYPDGTSENASNATDRKPRPSGALVKAALIASADDVIGGTNQQYEHRYNHEVGYGKLNLANVLPLVNDPATPTGLLVHDVGVPTGVTPIRGDISFDATGALPASTTATAVFDVVNGDEPLAIALAWVEGSNASGVLINNLDLELRYCGTDLNCTTTAGGDLVYFGNAFTEDTDDDGTLEDGEPDFDGDGSLAPAGAMFRWRSKGSWSLPNRDLDLDGTDDDGIGNVEAIAPRDTRNSTEAIFLSNDAEGDGTLVNVDNQVSTGKWQIKVRHTAAGTDTQKYALVIAGGVTVDSAIRIDTNPVSCNGDLEVRVFEVAKAPAVDAGCNTGACTIGTISARVDVEVRTANDVLVDKETGLTFTKDPFALGFISERLPVSTAVEGFPSGTPSDGILIAGDEFILRASYHDDTNGDGTLDTVKSGESVFECTPAIDFFNIAQPGRDAQFRLGGGCDDDSYLDRNESFTYRVRFGNLDVVTLEDVTVELRAVVPDEDDETDPCRLNNDTSTAITIPTSSLTIDSVDPGFTEDASFTLAVTNPPAWGASPAPPPEVELVISISSQKAGKTAAACGAFLHLLNARNESVVYSTNYPTGATIDRDLDFDEVIENPIRDSANPHPNCPGAQRDCVDGLFETITYSNMTTTAFGGGNPGFAGPWDFDTTNEDFRVGLYDQSQPGGTELTQWGEDYNYNNVFNAPFICQQSPGTTCISANPEGSNDPACAVTQCIGGGNAGNNCNDSSANCPGGFCPKRCMSLEDFRGDQDGTMDLNWSIAGGCGYASASGATGGVWHSGDIGTKAPCASGGLPETICEMFDIYATNNGTLGWLEFLVSPIVHKVHKNPDDRGVNWRVELADLAWNMNADMQAFNASISYEVDMDAESLGEVDLTDGLRLKILNNGLGPIATGNVNLTRGFPLFVMNNPDTDFDASGDSLFDQANGTNTATPNRNRTMDRSCFFWQLTPAAANFLLRGPLPADDDCDNDVLSLGPDGCPGNCGVDDDADNAIDNVQEGCPCFTRNDALDQDIDGRIDELDEKQRYYRCMGATSVFCRVTGANTDDCAGATGPCGHFGNGKPRPYGDDVCGDGRLDENLSPRWVDPTANGTPSFPSESVPARALGQSQNWNIGVFNGPFLRYQTLEDVYDAESGEQFQIAFGYRNFEGSAGLAAVQSYGAAVDDIQFDWTESHPVEQTAVQGCGTGVCSSGARVGELCFNADDCGGPACTGATASATSSCASVSWGANTLFQGSGLVSLNVVDFNAETTQGAFDCTRYGITSGCSGSCTASIDCDNDGRKEVEVEVTSSAEPIPEKVRLEAAAIGSSDYSALVTFSSSLSSASDSVVFLQYNGALAPNATAAYFDRDAGAGDVNLDGTTDSPPSNGRDRCPGFCGFDDDKDAIGPDKRAGAAIFDDDNNGVCDFKSTNLGAFCVEDTDSDGTNETGCVGLGATCLSIDEPDETCGRLCTGGTGLCRGGSVAGTSCTIDGNCTGGGVCARGNCISSPDCAGGGTCPNGECYNGDRDGSACTGTSSANAPTDCPAGYCGKVGAAYGDDNCNLIDETNETCAVVAGRLVSAIDDNCGCSANPLTAVINAAFPTGDLIVQSFAFTDNGDNDGFADQNELMTLSLTLRNLSSVDIDDVNVRISTQTPTIKCLPDPIAKFGRINKLQSAINQDALTFQINTALALAPGTVNRSSPNQLLVGTINVTVTGTALNDDGTTTRIEGTSTPQNFTFDLDLDVSGSAPVANTTKTFSFEVDQYATGGDWDADWYHTAFLDHDGVHCQYNDPSGLLTSHAPRGCFLRQDPNTQVPDDWHLHSARPGGGIANDDIGRDSGDPGTCAAGPSIGDDCSRDEDCTGICTNGRCSTNSGANAGRSCLTNTICGGGSTVCQLTLDCYANSDCTGTCSNDFLIQCTNATPCRFCNNDHSIPCTVSANCNAVGGSCGGAGTCDVTGTCPDESTCNGLGDSCMHMGLHVGGYAADTIHINNIFYTYFRGDDLDGTGGGTDRSPLQIGLGRPGTDDQPLLSFWHSLSIIDDRAVNVAYGNTCDAAVVHLLVDRNNDGTQQLGPPTDTTKDGWWTKGKPFYGAPRQQRQVIGNCAYDPDDDGNNEDDLDQDLTPNGRAKGPSSTCFPEFIWACVGDTGQPEYNPGIGEVEPDNALCFPEVDVNDQPILRDGPGRGRWIQSQFDLSTYKGRKIWFRFLTSHVQFGQGTWSAVLGAAVGGNRDDGWFIDDIQISGTAAAPFALKADTKTPPLEVCGASLCSGLTARVTGSTYPVRNDNSDNDTDGTIDETDEGAAVTVSSDAPLRNVGLNGQNDGTGAASASVGTCINGVLQYRFWADRDNDNTLDLPSELIRDYTENPLGTANPVCDEALKMDLRCSSAPNDPACQSRASLAVTVAGQVGSFDTVTIDALNPSGVLIWNNFFTSLTYDVAYKRISSSLFDGNFTTFVNPLGGTCVTGCRLTSKQYLVGCKGIPPPGNLDMWIVRGRGRDRKSVV